MSPSYLFFAPFFGGLASAATLYASHYSGTVHQLSFSGSSLTQTSSVQTNNRLPSWISYDGPGKSLYVPDENFYGGPGTLVSFSIGSNGALTKSGSLSMDPGVVASCLYGGANGNSFIANAH